MKKKNLVALMESVTVDELKNMISIKGRLEELERKKKIFEKNLGSVLREIGSIKSSIAKMGGRKLRVSSARKARKRIIQPSLSTVVVEILKEKKKALKIDEICNAVLHEKKYKTQAKNFKAQLRILLYKNEKGLFKKAGPGVFTLAVNSQKKL